MVIPKPLSLYTVRYLFIADSILRNSVQEFYQTTGYTVGMLGVDKG